jgi:signal transduction histidine kinase
MKATIHTYQRLAVISDDLKNDVASVARIDVVPTLLEVVCRTTGLGFAAIARVTEDRWIACAVRDEIAFGLQPGGELEVATTLCDEIRATRQAIIIEHATEDSAYCDHHTPKQYGFQSYISMPIFLRDGRFFGTLCAIDPKPAKLRTPTIEGMFRLFAELIAFHLHAVDRETQSQKDLTDARRDSDLREQFIAVLGHDLRSPLSAITASAAVLERMHGDPRDVSMLALIKRSVRRMEVLISDVMDFARGRLGAGISVAALPQVQLTPILEHVVSEAQTTNADRVIKTHIDVPRPVTCDAGRIGQLVANLLGNAIAHGDDSRPIEVLARINGHHLEVSVINGGRTIPHTVQARLFEPFYRASVLPNQQGLGLGLYIASEIARAHGGELTVDSAEGRICFRFRMPLGASG